MAQRIQDLSKEGAHFMNGRKKLIKLFWDIVDPMNQLPVLTN